MTTAAPDFGDYLERCEEIIERVGWVVQAVGPTEESHGLPWAYTIGLEEKNHPELFMVGLDIETLYGIVNTAVMEFNEKGWPHSGERVSGVIVGLDLLVVEVDPEIAMAGDWFNVAGARRGTKEGLWVFQLVWPDADGTFSIPEERQPRLGTVPTEQT